MAVTGFSTSNLLSRVVANDYNLPGTALTIHAWVLRSATGSEHDIALRWGADNTSRVYLLGLAAAGPIVVAIDDGVGADAVTASTAVGTGAWKSCALRKNGTGAGALQAWLNGVQDGSGTSNRSIQTQGADTGSQFRIGLNSTSANPFNGRIAEVAIWDVALSDAELVALSKGANPVTIRPDHLKGYFPLWSDVATQPQLGGSNGNVSRTGSLSSADHAPVSAPPQMLALAGMAA